MDKKKVGALFLGGLIVLAGGVATGFALDKPQTNFIDVPGEKVIIDARNDQLQNSFNEGVASVEIIEKTEYVDNGYLGDVIDWVQDEYDEDLDVDYILFEVESKMFGETWVEDHFKSVLKEEDYFEDGEVLDGYRKSEISIKKIYDPSIEDRDFEDKDLELVYKVKVRAQEDGEDKEYFDFEFKIPFVDGEFEEEDIRVSLLS